MAPHRPPSACGQGLEAAIQASGQFGRGHGPNAGCGEFKG
jgi:hypothetical protein